jgi:type I restriction enzyme, R subunit
MNKRDLSEADICAKFITPAVTASGWLEHTQIQREVHFTKGQIHVRGKMVTRGKSKFADYVLYYKPNIPIAIIEAKDNNHAIGEGMQQALEYGEILNIPFVFSSNGDGFVFHDRTGSTGEMESTLGLDAFPRPAQLWSTYCRWKASLTRLSSSCFRITSMTAVAANLATTNATP